VWEITIWVEVAEWFETLDTKDYEHVVAALEPSRWTARP
jgi:hypothetical protein